MNHDENFDQPVTNDEIDEAYNECKNQHWAIRNKHNGEQSNDFYNGQLAAYKNITALLMSHPKANDPDFAITICTQLTADVTMILGPRPRRLIGGPNSITYPG